MSKFVKFEDFNHTRVVTFNRPEKKNAFNEEMLNHISTIVKDKDFNGDITAQSFSNTPQSRQIKIVLTWRDGSNVTFDLGSENYLTNAERRNNDTGGGNVEAVYTFENHNTFSIS